MKVWGGLGAATDIRGPRARAAGVCLQQAPPVPPGSLLYDGRVKTNSRHLADRLFWGVLVGFLDKKN